MFHVENPVLQRELLVNLRMGRAFVMLFLYQALLALVVYAAWPQSDRIDMTKGSAAAAKTQGMVNLFFIGQYVLSSMMVPSFAAGSITGEKERKTYEMLLASPLTPLAILWGKLIASLAHVALLVFCSLPIVMLCLPLGGVSPYEVLAAYLWLILSIATFGTISVACSTYFQRTSAALVVSYLLILPLAMVSVLIWMWLSQGDLATWRLRLTLTVLPAGSALIIGLLLWNSYLRLLHPPDVGSEGKEVVDLEQEAQQAVGLVIQPDQFPDSLFAPPKRDDLMEDDANPVYDKEVRSEIFSQGTLMLRLVIQVSMLLAIPLMAWCLYIKPIYAAWYIGYVVIFNMLVGPVFSAGSVTSERERETLDLLLTTVISPWQILWGKLVAGLRISSVLTMFLLWPVLLACVMVNSYWPNLVAVLCYISIVLITCLTTGIIALFCSVLFQKTSSSLMVTYLVIILLFCAPLACDFFAQEFFAGSQTASVIHQAGLASPFAAAFAVPADMDLSRNESRSADKPTGDWPLFISYVIFTLGLDGGLFATMIWLFNTRWRVAG